MDIVVLHQPGLICKFQLTYSFLSYKTSKRIFLKTYLTKIPFALSLSSIFASANWLEREAWDMFGIKFLFHPNLRRILTDYNFKGHPLRKDFPIIGYVELIYNDSIQSIQVVPVEITQSLRFFEFLNPWIKFKNYDDI